MQLRELRLNETVDLEILGTEPELASIYEAMGQTVAIQGNLSLLRADADVVLVTGKLRFAPQLNCGRCDLRVPFPIVEEINTSFVGARLLAEREERARAEAAEPEEVGAIVEDYCLGDEYIDLTPLVNDTILLALPGHATPAMRDDGSCAVCLQDIRSDMVFSSKRGTESGNPFAVLKVLKK